MNITDHLDYNDETLQYELRIRNQKVLSLKYFLYTAMLSLIPLGLLNLLKFHAPALGIIELLISFMIFLVLRYVKLSVYFTLISILFVLAAGALVLSVFLGSKLEEGMLIWLSIFPLIAFYLLGRHKGAIAHAIFSLILLGMLTLNLHHVDYVISPIMLANVTGALIVLGIFAYYYEYTKYKAFAMIFHHSFSDELTNTGNRRMLTHILEKEKAFSHRHLRPLSIIMLDIDYFKSINDRFGHVVGDDVLIQFATLLKTNLRQSDFLFRWGGEEFVILLPGESVEQAHILAKKLHTIIENFTFNFSDRLTASFGVTEVFPGESEKETMRRLDYALYQAKNKGRNRVEIA